MWQIFLVIAISIVPFILSLQYIHFYHLMFYISTCAYLVLSENEVLGGLNHQ